MEELHSMKHWVNLVTTVAHNQKKMIHVTEEIPVVTSLKIIVTPGCSTFQPKNAPISH